MTAVEARERLKKVRGLLQAQPGAAQCSGIAGAALPRPPHLQARREGQRACGNVSIFPRQHLAFQAWDARGEAQRESEMCLAEEVGESGD